MTEAARTSETSVDNYFTRQYIPEDKSEHIHLVCGHMLIASPSLILQLPNNGHCHDQTLWKIGHQVYLNAVSCLSERDQSGCASVHQERSRCIYEFCDEGTWCFWQLSFRCCRLYYPNSIIITNFAWTIIPNCMFENIFPAYFLIPPLNKIFMSYLGNW
jgi:hypothetical protein